MRRGNFWIKLLAILWLGMFLWVEGGRVVGNLRGKEEVGNKGRVEVREEKGQAVVVTDEVYEWMKFNFENYPVVATWEQR